MNNPLTESSLSIANLREQCITDAGAQAVVDEIRRLREIEAADITFASARAGCEIRRNEAIEELFRVRQLIIALAQKWPGHSDVDYNSSTAEDLVKLIDDACFLGRPGTDE